MQANTPTDVDLQRLMNDMYFDNFMKVYNGISEKCFNACVYNFRTPKLADKEELCVDRCIEKFSRYSARVQRVYAEQNMLQQQEAIGTETKTEEWCILLLCY